MASSIKNRIHLFIDKVIVIGSQNKMLSLFIKFSFKYSVAVDNGTAPTANAEKTRSLAPCLFFYATVQYYLRLSHDIQSLFIRHHRMKMNIMHPIKLFYPSTPLTPITCTCASLTAFTICTRSHPFK